MDEEETEREREVPIFIQLEKLGKQIPIIITRSTAIRNEYGPKGFCAPK